MHVAPELKKEEKWIDAFINRKETEEEKQNQKNLLKVKEGQVEQVAHYNLMTTSSCGQEDEKE